MIPLQGNTTNLQGGYNPMGSTYNPMGNVASPVASPPKPTVTVKPASPSATPAVSPKQQYINDLSGRYGKSGSTIIRKSDNYEFKDPNEFYKDAGVSSFNNLKFDDAYRTPAAQTFINSQLPTTQPAGSGVTSMPPAPVSSPQSAYLEFLKKQFNPESLDAAGKSLNELNKRTSEELLRARNEEERIRKNEIGQVESGLNFSLNEDARKANRSLADLALAKGYQTENYNRLLGYGEDLYKTENELETKADLTLKSVAPALLEQLSTLKDQPSKDLFIRTKAAELGLSIDKINAALQGEIAAKKAAETKNLLTLGEGEAVWDPATQSFIYKNPKTYDPSNGNANSLGTFNLTTGQSNLLNGIINKYNASPLRQAVNRLPVLEAAINGVQSNPKDGALQLNLSYAYIQALDTYQSAVREGELGIVNSIDSKIGQFQNDIQRMQNGQIVRPEVAQQIANAAKNIVETIRSAAATNQQSYQSQASVFGLGDVWNQYISGGGASNPSGSGGSPDDIINKYLGFNSVGNTSGSTPYLSTLGQITAEKGGSPLWKWGLDIDLKIGQPVKTPISGQVIAVAPNGGFGNQVKIRAADGTEYWFSHLQQGTVKVGQSIPKGTVIGLGGNSGNTIAGPGGDGSHLDLTAKDKNGNYIPPEKIAQLLRQTYV